MRKMHAALFCALLSTCAATIARPQSCNAPVDCDRNPTCKACLPKPYDEDMLDADKRFKANAHRIDPQANLEVIGGEPVKGRFPEVVVLSQRVGDKICTGAVIAPRIVVTARHCLEQGVGVVGTAVKFGDDRAAPTGSINIDDAVPMPARLGSERGLAAVATLGTDVALVHLASQTPIKPAAIATDARVTANAAVRVVGFGRIEDRSYGKKYTARLIIASPDCKGNVSPSNARMSDPQFYGCIPVEMVASGRKDPTSQRSADTCGGDSGGPAYVSPGGKSAPAAVFEANFEGANPAYAIAGVTSRGIMSSHIRSSSKWTCGQGGIYTRLSGEVLKWIQETAQEKWKTTIGPPVN